MEAKMARQVIVIVAIYFALMISPKSYSQEEQNSSLYQKVIDSIENEYTHYLLDKSNETTTNNESIIFKGNAIGFEWNYGDLEFYIKGTRNIAPDLFDDKRWVVSDQFEISFDLTHFFNPDGTSSNESSPSGSDFKGMGKIVLRQIYTYRHYANDLKEALTGGLDRLFVPFRVWRKEGLELIGENEYFAREDYIALMAQGALYTPLYGPLSLRGAGLLKFEKVGEASLQKVSSQNNESKDVFISNEQKAIKNVGLSLGIELNVGDFLRSQLMGLNFNYQYENSKSINLLVNANEFVKADTSLDEGQALDKVLKGNWGENEQKLLAHYIHSSEVSKKEVQEFNWLAILLQGNNKKSTQSISVVNQDQETTFFKHYFEKNLTLTDPLTKLLNDLLGGNYFPSLLKNSYIENKKVSLEYQGQEDVLVSKNDFNQKSGNFSLEFKELIHINNKWPILTTKIKEKIIKRLEGQIGQNNDFSMALKTNLLSPPYKLELSHLVNKKGIESIQLRNYAQNLDILANIYQSPFDEKKNFIQKLFDHSVKVKKTFDSFWYAQAHHPIRSSWRKICRAQTRERYLFWNPFTWRQSHAFYSACLGSLSLKNQEERLRMIPLWSLKDFLDQLFIFSHERNDLVQLFGEKNIYSYGSCSAKNLQGNIWQRYLRIGEFSTAGVIEDSYQRSLEEAPSKH